MGTTRTVAALATVLVLAACGGDDGAAATVTVATAEHDLGTVLVDGDGHTLYLFDDDPEEGSACTDACADTWPPLEGRAEATGGADADQVGTVTRPDGTTQVTYGGHPLYHYAGDRTAGDATGQGIGDVWWAVAPDGSAVRDAATPAADTPAY